MSDPPKIQRILSASSPFCETHQRYHVLERSGEPTYCPVCRQERDEGLDLFNPEKKHGA